MRSQFFNNSYLTACFNLLKSRTIKTLCVSLAVSCSLTTHANQNLTMHNLANDAAPACFDGIGSVFKNCIDPTWQEAFTTTPSTQWQIINLKNPRQNVLDIKFSGQSLQKFGISAGPNSDPNTPHSWLDLTAFKTGKLHFDIRVMHYANNINGLEVSLGCGKNCKSQPIDINPAQQGQWQRVSINIHELITNGLEISQVHSAFEIQPVEGEQKGVHIQLDNIHFEANIPAPMDLVAL